MEIVYTTHARQRMLKRKINAGMVEKVLAAPTALSSGMGNKKIAFREFKQGVVEVVFVEEGKKKIIISVRWG